MLTRAGHSSAQALHPRHSSRASWRPSSARPAGSRPSSAPAQDRGAAARGVALVAEGLVARAHGPGAGAAGAVAVAGLAGAREAPLGREAHRRAPGAPRRRGRQPQVLVQPVRLGQHAGVQDPPGVEQPLQLAEGRDRPGRVHPRQQLAARPAVPVLTRQRPVQGADEVRGLLGDAPQRGDRAGRPQVHARADVQAAHARVPVPDGIQALAVEDPADAPGQLGQPLRRHGRVLDDRQGPRVARPGRTVAQGAPDPRPANGPHRRLLGRVDHHPRPGDPAQAVGHLGRISAQLHQELGRRAGVERGAGHQLHGRRTVGQRLHRRLERRLHRCERQQGQAAGRRALHQPQHGRAGHRQRPLAAAQQARPVGLVAREGAQVVARHPPQERRGPRGGGERPGRLHGGGRAAAPAEGGAGAVRQRHVDLEDVVRGQPVRDRARAGGVVGDHPAEGRPAPRGDVRPEEQAVGAGCGVQPVEHDAGTDARRPGRRVDGELVEGGAVDHQPRADRLPRQARAAAAHGERHAVVAAGGDGGVQIGGVPGAEARQRGSPVDARVGRVQLAGGRVVTHLARGVPAQLRDQSGSVHCRMVRPRRKPPRGAGKPPCIVLAGGGPFATLPGLHGAPGYSRAAFGPRVLRRGKFFTSGSARPRGRTAECPEE